MTDTGAGSFSERKMNLSTMYTSSARKRTNLSCGGTSAAPPFKDGFEARDEIEHDIEPIGLTLTRNEWFKLRVVAEGSRIAVAINDIEQGVFFDDTYLVGKVGVWTWDTQASFDDVTVNGATTASLTAIEPRGKLATSWAALKRK